MINNRLITAICTTELAAVTDCQTSTNGRAQWTWKWKKIMKIIIIIIIIIIILVVIVISGLHYWSLTHGDKIASLCCWESLLAVGTTTCHSLQASRPGLPVSTRPSVDNDIPLWRLSISGIEQFPLSPTFSQDGHLFSTINSNSVRRLQFLCRRSTSMELFNNGFTPFPTQSWVNLNDWWKLICLWLPEDDDTLVSASAAPEPRE